MSLDPDALEKAFAAKRRAKPATHSEETFPAPSRTAPPPARKVQTGSRQQKTEQKSELPHSIEAEQGIIGSMLVDRTGNTIAEVAREINRRYFYSPVLAEIFQALCDMWDSGSAVDLITFTQFLRDKGRLEALGGPGFITEIYTFVPTAANVRYYIEIVREKFVLREMITTGGNMVRAAHGSVDDPGEMLDSFTSKFDNIKKAAGGPNGAINFDIDALLAFDPLRDPDCLIGRRFLVRGGSWMIAGPTGCGKSSLLMQLAIYWATGTPMFGMTPVRPLKILIFQAEDDFGDVSEELQGIFTGIQASGDLDLEKFNDQIRKNLILKRVNGVSGDAFLSILEAYVQIHKPDLVGINPLFSYAGVDLLDPCIGTWLRDRLFSLGDEHHYCSVVMHHVAKPPREGGDPASTMYLGFGSSEVQNSFRAVSTLYPIKSALGVWRLDFGKRPNRAGAKDPEGELVNSLYMEHSKTGIYWYQVPEPESEMGKIDDILMQMDFENPLKTSTIQRSLSDEIGMPRRTFFRLWGQLKKESKIKEITHGKDKGWIKI